MNFLQFAEIAEGNVSFFGNWNITTAKCQISSYIVKEKKFV